MRTVLKALFALACLAVSACNASGSPAQTDSPGTRCDKWEKALSKDNRDAILYLVEQGCSGFHNGMRVAIEVSLPDGQRSTLFQYQDASWNAAYYGQTTPAVVWLNKHLLKISIGAVDTIEKKLQKAGDIKIEYHIRHVIAEEPRGHPMH